MYWRYNLSEGEVKSTIRSRTGGDRNRLVVYQRSGADGDGDDSLSDDSDPKRQASEGRRVGADEGDSSSAVQWAINCGRGKGKERSRGTMKIMGVLERIGRWSFQATHVRGVENFLADEKTRWNEDEIQTRLTAECPNVSWQAQDLGVGGTEIDAFGDFAHGYALGRVAKSTRKTYAQGWRRWVSWRVLRRKGNWLGRDMSEGELVEELADLMAYCFAERKNKEATVAGKLAGGSELLPRAMGGVVIAAAAI